MEQHSPQSPEPVPGFNALDYPLLGAFWIRQSELLKKINTSVRIIEELKNGYEMHAEEFATLNLKDCVNVPDLEGYHRAMMAMQRQLSDCQRQLDRLFQYAPTVSPDTLEYRQKQQRQRFAESQQSHQSQGQKRYREDSPDPNQPPSRRNLFF